MTQFKKLGLSKEVLKALKELGFETPTDIQEQSIPILLSGDTDFIGLAQTGTGKTAAFGLPLIELIDPSHKKTQGLILAPTRELGKQIAEQLHLFSKFQEKISVLPVYGGAAIYNQIKALKKTQHVIIATPGRLIDLIKRKAVDLSELKYLILDEADEMLNMGFKEELDKILSYTPEEKYTWLFSATMPSFIKKIVSSYMNDPEEIRINPKNEVNKNIKHRYVTVKSKDKTEALKRFLDIHQEMRGLVFCRTRRDTQTLAETLLQVGYRVDALHGDLSQAQRDRVMKRFKKNELQVLVATDVAARGIDVNDLSHVFHYTLPDDVPYYTHRSGRTARAGKKGVSISFVNGRELHKIKRLENALKIEFKKILVPDTKEVVRIRIKNWCKNILDKKSKVKIDNSVLEQANEMFAKLTKEELIAKIMIQEYEKLHVGSYNDLNDAESSPRSDRGGRGRDRGRGRGRNRDRGRDRGGKKSYGSDRGKRRSDSDSKKKKSKKKYKKQ